MPSTKAWVSVQQSFLLHSSFFHGASEYLHWSNNIPLQSNPNAKSDPTMLQPNTSNVASKLCGVRLACLLYSLLLSITLLMFPHLYVWDQASGAVLTTSQAASESRHPLIDVRFLQIHLTWQGVFFFLTVPKSPSFVV